MFINLTGPDCCGKTTQMQMLAEQLSRSNENVLALHIPTGRPAGYVTRTLLRSNFPKIGDDPLFVPMLRQSTFIADRYAAVPQIQQTLRRDGIVIVDRWKTCGEIYGVTDGLDLTWIKDAQSSLPDTDLNIYIDIPVDEAIRRLVARGRVPETYEHSSFQKRIVEQYHRTWKGNALSAGGARAWQMVNGMDTPERVHEAVFKIASAEIAARQCCC